MARFRIDFQLADGANQCEIRWRRGLGTPWSTFGRFGSSPAFVDIPDTAGRTEVNVRAIGADRRPTGPGKIVVADTEAPIENLPDPSTITQPEPNALQDGPVLAVTPDVPEGVDPETHTVEVRVGNTTSNPEDSIHVGYVKPGETINAPKIPQADETRVYTIISRNEDRRVSAWANRDVQTSAGAVEGVVGHETEFSSGTIIDLAPGVTPLEIDGSNRLVFKGQSLDDQDNVSLDSWGLLALDDFNVLPTNGTYQTPNIDTQSTEDFQFQTVPDTGPRTLTDFSLDDWGLLPLDWRSDQPTGFIDRRIQNDGLTLAGDRSPIQYEVSIATSASSSPTFNDADFKPYRVGEVRQKVRTYAVRWRLINTYYSTFLFIALVVRHWIFCKSRPWCLNSSASEFLYYEELTTTTDVVSTGSVDLTLYEYVDIEVRWIGAFPTAHKLEIFFNGDTGTAITLTPATWEIGQGREEMTIRVRPPIGVHRSVRVSTRARYDAAGVALDSTSDETFFWADSTTPLSSIQFRANDPNGLAAGSLFALYGKVLIG